MMTTNLFVIDNVKQLRTLLVLEFYCLFFWTSWSVGVVNSAIYNNFHNQVEFGTILEGLRNFGEGEVEPPLGTPLATPTSFFLTWSLKLYLVKRTDCKALLYADVSIPLFPHLS